MKKMTTARLSACGKQGRFAVGQLKSPHEQEGCVTVPECSRFVVKAARGAEVIALFPHDTPGIECEERAFADGHVRVVPLYEFTVVGRVGS